ncbi:MAG: class I SAM-dependent methyltransferase [Pseudomonadota bacterium]
MEKHMHNSKEMQRLSRKIDALDKPERIKAFPPEELLQMLPIKKSDSVLDLGAGTGYLTIPAARMTDGSVYALDIDPGMLEVISAKAQSEGISNIQLLEGSIDDITLPDASADIVLASLVLHEVKPLSGILQQVRRVLKNGGYFLCFEYEKTEAYTDGPPMNIRIPSSVMEQEMESAGFYLVNKLQFSDNLYVLIVKKDESRHL